ncbi:MULTISPECIES: hypothetical protein [Pseudomonas]|uniref:hypothetical protein n=1 Tax=Pseudomonas TaxID=286 RepID=UPI001E5A5EFF|nr:MULTISPECIES: hypothetical protein [Pseudomonas]UHH32738.1 hypothetical protein LUW10_13355 [Pseudomonas veronii]
MNIDYWLNLPIKFWFSASVLFVALSINVVGIFLMYRRLDEMEERLNKCSLIIFHKRFWGNSARGRMVRLCAVTAAVAMPGWNIKRGVVDRQQVQDFPRGLKRLFQGTLLVGVLFLISATADILYKWLYQ